MFAVDFVSCITMGDSQGRLGETPQGGGWRYPSHTRLPIVNSIDGKCWKLISHHCA